MLIKEKSIPRFLGMELPQHSAGFSSADIGTMISSDEIILPIRKDLQEGSKVLFEVVDRTTHFQVSVMVTVTYDVLYYDDLSLKLQYLGVISSLIKD